MAELAYTADYQDAEEMSFDPVPIGKYAVVIEESDYLDAKSGNGRYLKLVYQIIDGEYKGKKLFNNLNLENNNQQAVQIARRSLNAICQAVDVQDIEDSAELHNIPLMVEVGIKNNADYGPQNVIKKHFAIDGPKPDQGKETSAKKQNSSKKQPWKK